MADVDATLFPSLSSFFFVNLELESKAVVNMQQMQAIFGGNKQLMSHAVTMFITSSKEVPEQITLALATHNFEKLHRTVHQCKGSAGYIGAERVATISLTLQTAARELQQQQAASAEPGSVVAPLYVRAQVHALTSCMKELFDELEKVTTQ
ncbi:signal transduction histidine kinase [Pavlovales sp. CCMP2436]|nr:signal transduction histidine kinase [Pavlovales sp. CCMP2436]